MCHNLQVDVVEGAGDRDAGRGGAALGGRSAEFGVDGGETSFEGGKLFSLACDGGGELPFALGEDGDAGAELFECGERWDGSAASGVFLRDVGLKGKLGGGALGVGEHGLPGRQEFLGGRWALAGTRT